MSISSICPCTSPSFFQLGDKLWKESSRKELLGPENLLPLEGSIIRCLNTLKILSSGYVSESAS